MFRDIICPWSLGRCTHTIPHTRTHNSNPAFKRGKKSLKSSFLSMSISLEGQKCWNWCQHQRYYGPMKYLRNPPKLSTCSSTSNSDLNRHQNRNWPILENNLPLDFPLKCLRFEKKTKQNRVKIPSTGRPQSPKTSPQPPAGSKKSNAYMVIVQAFSVRLVHLGLAEERKHSSNVWHGIILEKMTSPIRKEETHTGEDPESQFRQFFCVTPRVQNLPGATSITDGHVLFVFSIFCCFFCSEVLSQVCNIDWVPTKVLTKLLFFGFFF